MNKKDGLYCSIINGTCKHRNECNDCKAYKNAINEAYNKTMDGTNKKYGIKQTYQKQLPD